MARLLFRHRAYHLQYKCPFGDVPRRAQQGKLSMEYLTVIDNTLEEDDETSAAELHALLLEAGVRVSISTIHSTR